jgi:hypothetical protein
LDLGCAGRLRGEGAGGGPQLPSKKISSLRIFKEPYQVKRSVKINGREERTYEIKRRGREERC